MRTDYKVNPKPNKRYTVPMSHHGALGEARATQRYRDLIERHNERFNKPLSSRDSLENSLMIARATTTPFQIFGVAEAQEQKKLYMLMTPEGGSLDKVLPQMWTLPREMRGFLVTSLAAQTFTELEALHAANVVHRDIKLDNIFFGPTGQFKLMDFGISAAANPRTKLTEISGEDVRVTSLLVPESYAPVQENGQLGAFPTVGVQMDVWTLAATVVNMSGSSQEFRQFFYPPTHTVYDPQLGYDREDTRQNSLVVAERMRMFDSWKASLPRRPGDGMIDPIALSHDRSFFGELFAPLARVNPELCALLVDTALQTDPQKRISAAELAQRVRALLATVPNVVAKRDMTAQFLANLDGSNNPEAAADASAFRQWAQSHPDRLDLPVEPGTRPVYGVYRNLP
jgi:serine/threonine protein kinase